MGGRRSAGVDLNETLSATRSGQSDLPESSQALELLLIVMTGANVGRIYALPRSKPLYLIGREDGADVQIFDGEISRRHAVIRYDAKQDRYLLSDLNSRNGTHLNGERGSGEMPLAVGDKIRLGTQTILRVSRSNETEARYAKQMYQAVLRDALTGAFNRRYLDERLDGEIAFAVRHHEPLSVLLLDLDHFKAVNDNHGHLAGDAVLKHFCALLQAKVRTEDVVARFGGEEFAVVCRNTAEERAAVLAERLRDAVAHSPLVHEGTTISVTVSIGVAGFKAGSIDTPKLLLDAADATLYGAKSRGRNRVWLHSQLGRPGADEPTKEA